MGNFRMETRRDPSWRIDMKGISVGSQDRGLYLGAVYSGEMNSGEQCGGRLPVPLRMGPKPPRVGPVGPGASVGPPERGPRAPLHGCSTLGSDLGLDALAQKVGEDRHRPPHPPHQPPPQKSENVLKTGRHPIMGRGGGAFVLRV